MQQTIKCNRQQEYKDFIDNRLLTHFGGGGGNKNNGQTKQRINKEILYRRIRGKKIVWETIIQALSSSFAPSHRI